MKLLPRTILHLRPSTLPTNPTLFLSRSLAYNETVSRKLKQWFLPVNLTPQQRKDKPL